jgi:decaprenylphospho-beta-D-ribofuranose 2-oxidase
MVAPMGMPPSGRPIRSACAHSTQGLLTVEAGALLGDIIAALLPRGWFPAVVPGTRLVTVGGAIAADVHGKNHHRDGGFGDHVESLQLATGDGRVLTCSRNENADLFQATVGGMGLTGTILQAQLRLRQVETSWIRQRTTVAPNLGAAMGVLSDAHDTTYSVAWIDCLARGASLGRSLVYLGEHASLSDLAGRAPFGAPAGGRPAVSVPFDLPSLALNRLSVRAFNEAYFHWGARQAASDFLAPANGYFFPLDGIGDWNRIYGRRGFVQHQCVVPEAAAERVLPELLGRIAARGDASFLTVLKKLGPSHGLLSFPMAGYTLALDLPMSRDLLPFLDELDGIVTKAGGRLYLAKDARQSRATFESGYPDLSRFRDIRAGYDPQGRIASRQSLRLGI